MPKTIIDYSNTIIYKITCKDTNVSDVYVGHTTNFIQRKHAHKQGCINDKCKLYEAIRNNGGWDNWNMDIINFFNCKDHFEARQKEQEYFVSLNATLNSIEPMPKQKCKPIKVTDNKITQPLHCQKCNKEYSSRVGLWKHKKICDANLIDNNETNNIDITDLNIIIQLIKQNDCFKKLLLEQSKSLTEQNKSLTEQNKSLTEQNNTLIEQNKIIIELYKNKS